MATAGDLFKTTDVTNIQYTQTTEPLIYFIILSGTVMTQLSVMVTVSILVIEINIYREKDIDIFPKIYTDRKALEQYRFIYQYHFNTIFEANITSLDICHIPLVARKVLEDHPVQATKYIS